jgi:hypothetical protein
MRTQGLRFRDNCIVEVIRIDTFRDLVNPNEQINDTNNVYTEKAQCFCVAFCLLQSSATLHLKYRRNSATRNSGARYYALF